MLEKLLIENVAVAILVCVAFYLADYLLTVYEARLYRGGAEAHLNIQGQFSSSTIFHFESPVVRWWNPQYLWVLLLLAIGVGAAWYGLTVRLNLPEVFSFLLGGLLLGEAAGMVRQVRRISLYRYLRDGRGLSNAVEVSRRLNLTQWYHELYGFTALYLLCFLITGSWFFLGGVLTCFITSRRQRDYTVMLPEPYSRRERVKES